MVCDAVTPTGTTTVEGCARALTVVIVVVVRGLERGRQERRLRALGDAAGLALGLPPLPQAPQSKLVHLHDLRDSLLDDAQHLHDVAVGDPRRRDVLQRSVVVAAHLHQRHTAAGEYEVAARRALFGLRASAPCRVCLTFWNVDSSPGLIALMALTASSCLWLYQRAFFSAARIWLCSAVKILFRCLRVSRPLPLASRSFCSMSAICTSRCSVSCSRATASGAQCRGQPVWNYASSATVPGEGGGEQH